MKILAQSWFAHKIQNLENVFIRFLVSTLNWLVSTLEQRLRISCALMVHFFLSAVYITRKLGENEDVF